MRVPAISSHHLEPLRKGFLRVLNGPVRNDNSVISHNGGIELFIVVIFKSSSLARLLCTDRYSLSFDRITAFEMGKDENGFQHVEARQIQDGAIEGHLKKKFSKLTMIGMAFAILK
jgi:hypothetical protein